MYKRQKNNTKTLFQQNKIIKLTTNTKYHLQTISLNSKTPPHKCKLNITSPTVIQLNYLFFIEDTHNCVGDLVHPPNHEEVGKSGHVVEHLGGDQLLIPEVDDGEVAAAFDPTLEGGSHDGAFECDISYTHTLRQLLNRKKVYTHHSK